MILYDDSFVKTAFFTKEIPNWEIPIFYFDFDLQYTGFVRAGRTPTPKNLTLFYCQENDSFRKDLKSVIEKISNTKVISNNRFVKRIFQPFRRQKRHWAIN